jgi:hypothetical protein
MTVAEIELVILQRLKDTGNKPVNHRILDSIPYSNERCRQDDFETTCEILHQKRFIDGELQRNIQGNLQYNNGCLRLTITRKGICHLRKQALWGSAKRSAESAAAEIVKGVFMVIIFCLGFFTGDRLGRNNDLVHSPNEKSRYENKKRQNQRMPTDNVDKPSDRFTVNEIVLHQCNNTPSDKSTKKTKNSQHNQNVNDANTE